MKSRRWALGLAALPPLVGIATALLAPEPHGHWVQHLSSAGLKATQLAVIAFAALLLRRAWRPLLLVCLAVAAVGIAFQVIGDWGVAQSIWRTTGDPGFGVGYEEGHATSGLGDLLAVIGGLGFAIVGGFTRRLRIWVAVAAAVLTILPPPFFWPAVGILGAMLHAYVTGGEFRPAPRLPSPEPPVTA